MIRRFPRSSVAIPVLVISSLFLVGCNSMLVGDWRADPAPEGLEFYINKAKFKDDNTFTAVAHKQDSDPVLLGGNYVFNGLKLTLRRPGKKDRVYPAVYHLLTDKLQLKVEDKKYYLKKQ